ncbi:unnamed protein product [Vitrella brassicaformis CCMP3155]|uniref:Protein kinase domain-containing protein n=1 Tax=Vitrella brassicaformis (strain CCMP3155) TaxID=1169540 RepID=A0A0G4FZ34_VITBC|nr:unnamed protein product [Vitrella brassicaformis CCMP3155]|eukprot:CEM20880.1 unnamed protein product [Vitrella brassicaformis CCMP3155]
MTKRGCQKGRGRGRHRRSPSQATGEGATPAGSWVVTKSVSGLVQAGVGREKVRANVQRDSDTLRLLYFAASDIRQHRLPDLLHGRRYTGVRRCVPEWPGFLSQEELAAGKVAMREAREGGAAVNKRMTDLVAEEGVCYVMGMVVGTTDRRGHVFGADTVDHLCRPPIPSRRPPGPLLRGAVSVNMVLALLHIHRHHHITHNDFHYRNVHIVADLETGEVMVIDFESARHMQSEELESPVDFSRVSVRHLDTTLDRREVVDETVIYATDCIGAASSFMLLASPTDATAKGVKKLAETELEELLKECEAARSQQGEGEAAQATREGAREAYKATVASIAAAASSHIEEAIEASEQPEAAKWQWKALGALSVQLYRELGMGHADGMGHVEMWARLDKFYNDTMTVCWEPLCGEEPPSSPDTSPRRRPERRNETDNDDETTKKDGDDTKKDPDAAFPTLQRSVSPPHSPTHRQTAHFPRPAGRGVSRPPPLLLSQIASESVSSLPVGRGNGPGCAA